MQQAGAFDGPGPDAPADLLELLLDRFVATPRGREVAGSPPLRDALVQFLELARGYLRGNPVVGQGMLDGGLTLVLRDGESVPLVKPADAGPPRRPEPVYAVTTPRDCRMKGMTGGEAAAIPVTGRGPEPRR
jgi:hypothetical protein